MFDSIRSRRLITLAVVAIAAPAGADTTLVFNNTGADSDGQSSIEIADGYMRSDSAAAGDVYTLFRAGNEEFVMVNNKERSYMIFDKQTVEQAAAAARQAMEQMEASLAQMPPAQREQMRSMMGKMMGGMMDNAPEPRRYERGGSSEVAGYACENLKIYLGDRLASEQCVSAPDTLDMDDADFETIRSMQQFVVDLTSQFSFMANMVMDYGEPGQDEMPIRYTLHLPMMGSVTGELVSVSSDDIDAARFEIPAGYKQEKMPEMPKLGR